MTEVWDATHLQSVLDTLAPDIHIRFFENSTATSQMAADNIGCELGQIAKCIVFLADGTPIVVIASGDQRVDDRKLAALMGVSRKKVRTATADECITITGYAPGGVPPLGHRQSDIRIFIDDSLGRYATIYAAAGAYNAIMPMAYSALLTLTGGTSADLKRETDPAAGA